MRNLREIILFFNIIRFNNQRILEFIESGLINDFINPNNKSIKNIQYLKESEKELILDNLSSFNIDFELHKLSKLNIRYSCITDDDYPRRLKTIYNAPSLLYYKGNGFDYLENTLSIVGTRKPTSYGIWSVKKIISDLSTFNLKIVSGMALGIDYYAHNEAIERGIPTIGVLASSIDIMYPRTNIPLYRKMENELLISEFPLGTNPIKRNFVQRNRIIAGLSFGTLVVEAADRSGSLITANFALEQNREVYAIPGNINSIYSMGSNNLINKGAKLIISGKDIIEELEFVLEKDKIEIISDKTLDESSLVLIEVLKNNLLTIDEIVAISKLDIRDVYSIITRLEIDDIIIKIQNKYTLN